jgi:hypothetical protein
MNDELTSLKRKYIDVMTANIPEDLSDLREEVAEFITYSDVTTWGVKWAQDNVDFLQEVGLPVSAPTMIEFQSPAEIGHEHVYVGFNNYGDRIAIVKATGNVVYLNHDSHNRIEYMNRDAISLFKSICAFADMVTGEAGFAKTIAVIDSEAVCEDHWWHREHVAWLSKIDRNSNKLGFSGRDTAAKH